jgi:hypothetical protein
VSAENDAGEGRFGEKESSMLRTVPCPDAPSTAVPRAASAAPLSEEDLAVAYAVHGDERAFRALHERTAPFLRRVAYRRVTSLATSCNKRS